MSVIAEFRKERQGGHSEFEASLGDAVQGWLARAVLRDSVSISQEKECFY